MSVHWLKNRFLARLAARGAPRARRARGMTLVEVMIVLAILGMMAGAIGIAVFKKFADARRQTASLELKQLSNAIDLYNVQVGNYPDALQQLVPKFVPQLHKDPWGSEYQYVKQGEGFEVYSYGEDRAPGGGDDITIKGGEGADSSDQKK